MIVELRLRRLARLVEDAMLTAEKERADALANWAGLIALLLLAKDQAGRGNVLSALDTLFNAELLEIEIVGDCPASGPAIDNLSRALGIDPEDVFDAWSRASKERRGRKEKRRGD